jgi:hypothetical protein
MNWRKSTYSSGNGGECVEVVGHANRVLVRDTKDRSGPVLRFTPGAWRRFADRVRRPLAGWPRAKRLGVPFASEGAPSACPGSFP